MRASAAAEGLGVAIGNVEGADEARREVRGVSIPRIGIVPVTGGTVLRFGLDLRRVARA
jgi:hypothetical protein